MGVSKNRNPFGLGFNSKSTSYRYERSVEVEEEDVPGPSSATILSVEERSILALDDESSEDEDDIVDIPPTSPVKSLNGYGTIRARPSRQSLRRPSRPISREFD